MSKINSREGLLLREQEVLRLINLFSDHKFEFIVVGGYAISTYKKRFSIDLDIVIKEDSLALFENALEKESYSFGYEKKISLLYGENFKRFSKKINRLPVDVDLLINGLVSRTTDATWSFDYIKKHSAKRKLSSSEFLTPEKELLIAMKFHSGRLTDIKDIAAIMPCDVERLKQHLLKGDLKKLKDSMGKQADFLSKPQFDDSFKGIFGPYSYNEKNVLDLRKIVKDIILNLKKG